MGRPPSFLPKPDVSLHWAPQSYISPCFHHVGHDDAVVGCLTGAVKALHENRLALDALQRKADADKKDWDRRKQELEHELSALRVRNAEAERLFKLQEQQLRVKLEDATTELNDLQTSHNDLKDTSSEQIKELTDRVAQLQQACDELEADRAALQAQLRDAELTAQARRDAERRVADLESAIAAARSRANKLTRTLTQQRDDAAAARDRLQGKLESAQLALLRQKEQCDRAKLRSKKLLLSNQQLTNSLLLERIINEPLRHTNHASTTIAHVMRSQAAPLAADRARMPITEAAHPPLSTLPIPGPTYLTPTNLTTQVQDPPTLAPTHPNAAADITHTTPPATASEPLLVKTNGAPDDSELIKQTNTPVMSNKSEDGCIGTEVEPEFLDITLRPQQHGEVDGSWAGAEESHLSTVHGMHGEGGGVGGDTVLTSARSALTRLGRAWATTTPTAGSPHSVYADNVQRFERLYGDSELTAAVELKKEMLRMLQRQNLGAPRPLRDIDIGPRRVPGPGEIEDLVAPGGYVTPRAQSQASKPRTNVQKSGVKSTKGLDGSKAERGASGGETGTAAAAARRPSEALRRTYQEARDAAAARAAAAAELAGAQPAASKRGGAAGRGRKKAAAIRPFMASVPRADALSDCSSDSSDEC